ncbi:MAG: pilus assembly protein [Lachnospiraceae bacterium]|jgi:hypothetical protein|nr:pilus assembly protein [Lachnospiraceae bacterium]
MRVIGESDRQIRTRDVGGQRNGLVRAAFTVEAALIMPVILMVILSSLYLCMHVHNRNYLRSYAVEQSISGHEQPDPALLFSSDISASRTDGGNMRTVSYTAGTVYYTGRRLYSISEHAGYRKVKPVTYLWRMRAVKKIFGQG